MTAIHQHNKNIGTRRLLIFCLQILYCRVTVVVCKRLLQTIRHLVSDKSFLMLLSASIESVVCSVTSGRNNTEISLNIVTVFCHVSRQGGRKMLKIGRLGLFQRHLENTWATYQETMKSKNYRKQPYRYVQTQWVKSQVVKYYKTYKTWYKPVHLKLRYKSRKTNKTQTAIGISLK